MTATPEPTDRFHQSQGLRLHVTDWGNDAAPPLILLHGGRDHSRSWDTIARALQPHFHVMAPDLRGHGDSEWAKGSSYSLSDHVYDLAHLLGSGGDVVLVGHSFGGMIAMAYAGTYPDRVSRLAVLDGAFLHDAASAPIAAQMAAWVAQLDRIAQAKRRRFSTVEEAAERRRHVELEVRSLPGRAGALPAVARRLYRAVVADHLSDAAAECRRKLPSGPRQGRPGGPFPAGRSPGLRRRRPLAAA
jgi:pimeloyl-ACP methyl ester carboxylesterase